MCFLNDSEHYLALHEAQSGMCLRASMFKRAISPSDIMRQIMGVPLMNNQIPLIKASLSVALLVPSSWTRVS